MQPQIKKQRLDPHTSGSSSTFNSSASSSSSSSFSSSSVTTTNLATTKTKLPRDVQRSHGQEIDGWLYISKETLEQQSPSAAHFSLNEQAKRRFIGCQYINDLCQELNIGIGPRCVAHGLFHRFYARQSFKTHPEMDVATTCVFLSIKIEEVKEINLSKVLAAEKAVRKISSEKSSSSQMFTAKDKKNLSQEKILILERVLLHSIAFEICITTPFNYLKKLRPHVSKWNPENWHKLNQLAHQFIIDSHGTTLCLQYPPHVLAVSAIYLASKFSKVKLQDEKKQFEYHWWQQLPGGQKANRDDILDCCHQMLAVFEKPTE
jgi:protein BUR2